MGCDPTIGDPARVATRAGSFLSEQPDYSEVASYKDGWSAAIPTTTYAARLRFQSP